jgi:hypothetical protein
MPLLGIPWIYGYFILDTDKTLIFSYIFTIINSSQGTILFLIHCIALKRVRREIIKYLFPRSNKTLILSRTDSTAISKANSATTNSVNIKRETIMTNVPTLVLTSQADVETPTPTLVLTSQADVETQTPTLLTPQATQNTETSLRETYTTYFSIIPSNCQ